AQWHGPSHAPLRGVQEGGRARRRRRRELPMRGEAALARSALARSCPPRVLLAGADLRAVPQSCQ
ncbi:unnamed protein product, partial [Polarella glacialis]